VTRGTPIGRPLAALTLPAVLVLAAVLGMAACSRGADPVPAPADPTSSSLDALSAATDLVNQGRATALERARKVTEGLERRDAVDGLASAGDRSAVRSADDAADTAITMALGALDDLGPALAAYQRGIDDLGRAATSSDLSTEQRRLIGTVVAAVRAEISATRDLASAVRAGVPAYTALAGHLDEWIRRARAGWYRNETEAANAYAVLVGDTRAALDRVRAAVARADEARAAAGERTTEALRAARAALAPLTTRPTELPPSRLPGG